MSEPESSEATGRGSETRRRLVDAAQTLLAERDIEEITLRDITTAAEANVAAVNYHFGSKDKLLTSIVERALTDRASRYVAALDCLTSRNAATDVESVVRAAFGADLASRGDDSEIICCIGARLAAPGTAELRALAVSTHTEASARLEQLLGALLPGLCREELLMRITLMHYTLSLLRAGAIAEQLVTIGMATASDAELEERIVAYLVGALSAPPAGVPAPQTR